MHYFYIITLIFVQLIYCKSDAFKSFQHPRRFTVFPSVSSQLDPFLTVEKAGSIIKSWNEANYARDVDDSAKVRVVSHTVNLSGDSSQSIEVSTQRPLKALHYLKDKWFSTSNAVRRACSDGYVRLNGRKIYSTAPIKDGDQLEIDLHDEDDRSSEVSLKKDNLQRLVRFANNLMNISNFNPPLHVLYEDDYLAVVYKPAGVHSLKYLGTMKKRLYALDDVLLMIMQPPSASVTAPMKQPRPCHRLDYRVPGCLLVAKTYPALRNLSQQFEDRSTKKRYKAVVIGDIRNSLHEIGKSVVINEVNIRNSPSGETIYDVHIPVGARNAHSSVQVLEVLPCNIYGFLSLISLVPHTGRRHQLRQHCAAVGCPIMGDDLYHDAAFATSDLKGRLAAIGNVNTNSISDSNRNEKGSHKTVRKGVGLLLSSVSIDFAHPTGSHFDQTYINRQNIKPSCKTEFYEGGNGEYRINVAVPEPIKFRRILDKARSGAEWSKDRRNELVDKCSYHDRD